MRTFTALLVFTLCFAKVSHAEWICQDFKDTVKESDVIVFGSITGINFKQDGNHTLTIDGNIYLKGKLKESSLTFSVSSGDMSELPPVQTNQHVIAFLSKDKEKWVSSTFSPFSIFHNETKGESFGFIFVETIPDIFFPKELIEKRKVTFSVLHRFNNASTEAKIINYRKLIKMIRDLQEKEQAKSSMETNQKACK